MAYRRSIPTVSALAVTLALTPMPVGGTLDTIDTSNLRNWINNGAPDN